MSAFMEIVDYIINFTVIIRMFVTKYMALTEFFEECCFRVGNLSLACSIKRAVSRNL